MKNIMKTIVLSAALILPVANAQANGQIKLCNAISEMAYMVMDKRQMGVPMQELMPHAGNNSLAQGIILEAYERPRVFGEDNRYIASVQFRNEWAYSCLKVQMEDAYEM